jgi:hypothetical protein
VAQKVKSLLRNLFLDNWPRKAISVALAVIIWLMVNHSLSTTRIVSNVMVRVVNLPPGKTVEGLQPGGTLAKKITLTLSGNKNVLESLTSNDLEVVVDAANAGNEMVINIDKKSLVSLNPELEIGTSISRVSGASIVLRPMRLVTEKIPIIVTSPIGEAPRGYQFIDIFPYRLFITVSGPEKAVKRLKDREIRLTFNLNDISRSQLEGLVSKHERSNLDEVSFLVPDTWKQISIPSLSDTPLAIDDPDAKFLRIDFIRRDLLPLDKPIPVSVFYPPDLLHSLNPSTLSLAEGPSLALSHGIFMIEKSLAVKGVSRLFLEVVKDHLEIIVVAQATREMGSLPLSLQFIDPKKLEDKNIDRLTSEPEEEGIDLAQGIREDYLRNRFRSYMTKMQLFYPDDTRFDLKAVLHGNSIEIQEIEIPSNK